MANYTKRDARKAWVADMAANRGKRIEPDPPRWNGFNEKGSQWLKDNL